MHEGERLVVQYGALEGMLATLFDMPKERVRSRFRKLRLAGFPDDIQTGSGTRVAYDLSRILAFSAVFALADGLASQNEAVRIVQSSWPEWCRAFIGAGATRGLVQASPLASHPLRSTISIAPEGLAARPRSLLVATLSDEAPAGCPAVCRLVFDVAPLLAAVIGIASDEEVVGQSLKDLNARFGWDAVALSRGRVADMPLRGSFLIDGPYYERALAYLDAVVERPLGKGALWRLGVIGDYLRYPAPVDSWKGEIGHPGGPSLREWLLLLGGYAGINGGYPHAIAARMHEFGEPEVVARDLIERAQRVTGTGGLESSVGGVD